MQPEDRQVVLCRAQTQTHQTHTHKTYTHTQNKHTHTHTSSPNNFHPSQIKTCFFPEEVTRFNKPPPEPRGPTVPIGDGAHGVHQRPEPPAAAPPRRLGLGQRGACEKAKLVRGMCVCVLCYPPPRYPGLGLVQMCFDCGSRQEE